jgi:HEAT repeat protein
MRVFNRVSPCLCLAFVLAACTPTSASTPAPATAVTPEPAPPTEPATVDADLSALAHDLLDPDEAVAMRVTGTLLELGTKHARDQLLASLETVDEQRGILILSTLRDGWGGEGLTLAFDRLVPRDKHLAFSLMMLSFDFLERIADPRAADGLAAFLQVDSRPAWRFRAASCLAQLGDLRSVDALAVTLRTDPSKEYRNSPIDQERALARSDGMRIAAARYLADLAVLHPDALPMLQAKAEGAVMAWLTAHPWAHANGMRFLAAVRSEKGIALLRKWAFPAVMLPQQGQQPPFPEEFVVAQSALRYLAQTKDATSWPLLEKQLRRRVTEAGNADVSMDALMRGGAALQGMAVRALGMGVANGYAEWGDTRAAPILIKYIENPRENEQARVQGCKALAWVTPPDKVGAIADKVVRFARSKKKGDEFTALCLAQALVTRPSPSANPKLLALLIPTEDAKLRRAAAIALGRAGLTEEQSKTLLARMADPRVCTDAATAVLLGGTPAAASRAVAMFESFPPEARDAFEEAYSSAFPLFTNEDLERGRLYRWVENSWAVSHKAPWVEETLVRKLSELRYDKGPHTLTRVVLRYRLRQTKGTDDSARALEVLRLMGEEKGRALPDPVTSDQGLPTERSAAFVPTGRSGTPR